MGFEVKAVGAAFFVCVCLAPALVAQKGVPSDPCHARPSDKKTFFTFDQLDREFRDAILHNNVTELALLVQFPLRINDEGGTISINDAAALQAHYAEIITPKVKQQVMETGDFVDETCNDFGIAYGYGAAWVSASDRGYAIQVINRDAGPRKPNEKTGKLEYVCQTGTYRVVIDAAASGTSRYRSWKKPQSLTTSPDLEIANGKQAFEGTGICSVPVYSFRNGTTTCAVDAAMGCGTGAEPKDATGRLTVTDSGKTILEAFCY